MSRSLLVATILSAIVCVTSGASVTLYTDTLCRTGSTSVYYVNSGDCIEEPSSGNSGRVTCGSNTITASVFFGPGCGQQAQVATGDKAAGSPGCITMDGAISSSAYVDCAAVAPVSSTGGDSVSSTAMTESSSAANSESSSENNESSSSATISTAAISSSTNPSTSTATSTGASTSTASVSSTAAGVSSTAAGGSSSSSSTSVQLSSSSTGVRTSSSSSSSAGSRASSSTGNNGVSSSTGNTPLVSSTGNMLSSSSSSGGNNDGRSTGLNAASSIVVSISTMMVAAFTAIVAMRL